MNETDDTPEPAALQRVVVIGAGVMGHGIAQIAAMSGMNTVLCDLDARALERATARVAANLDKGVARGKVSDETRATALEALSTATDFSVPAAGADLVVEAVPEDMGLKERIFSRLADVCPEHAVLGTNTSSLSVTQIAASTTCPERVVGMHFFNPVHIVRLLEVVRAMQTSESTLGVARAFGQRTSRELIVVNDNPGFATSRLGLVIGLEAIRMLEAGVASAEDIDRAMELGYRHPMGPLKLTDLVGLDTRLKIAEHLHAEIGEQFRPPPLLRQMVRAGKLGKKSGEGFYRW